jgi:hypothetical protein
MTFTDEEPPRPARRPPRPDETLTQADLKSPDRSLLFTPRPAPLASWSRLWAVVRDALRSDVPGRDPDVPALLRAWDRGEILHRVPRVPRHVWAGRASVWVDRSARLVPFWSDQTEVCRRLRAACGRSGLDVRLLDAETQAWSVARRGDMLAGIRPDPESPVLVLGDLGAYGSAAERAAWLRTARRLRCTLTLARIAALVPVPRGRWDPQVAEAWGAAPWERGRTSASANARQDSSFWQARAERLLRVTSPAALVQPGLLRELRRILPAPEADAASEADAFCHMDVRAADASGIVLHPEAAVKWRRAFASEETSAVKARVSESIGRWHAGLPAELVRAETLAWLSLVPAGVARPPSDAADAIDFAARLEASAMRTIDDLHPASAAVRRYARALLSPMPAGAYEAVPALKRVWAAAFKDVTGVHVPEGLDAPALYRELEGAEELRWWTVRQVGGTSCSRQRVWTSLRGSPERLAREVGRRRVRGATSTGRCGRPRSAGPAARSPGCWPRDLGCS